MNIDQPAIPNTLLETMFLRIATDETMGQYSKYTTSGNLGLATAYASRIVYKTFFHLIEGSTYGQV